MPYTNDHINPQNQLIKKFVFEPKIISARSFIFFHQGGITQSLLHHLKYKGSKEIGYQLGEWFSNDLKDLSLDVIIPVPLHKSKLRKRGYNQSEYFAKGMGDNLGVRIISDGITREVSTSTQTKKSKVKRWIDLENVYSKAPEHLSGKSVLVVDDVITTGATVGMLCSRLVEVNVKEIHIASIARGK